VTEVHKEPEFTAGGAKIVQKAARGAHRPMPKRLDFDNGLVVADEIGGERLNESAVRNIARFAVVWPGMECVAIQIHFQALVVDGFEKAAALLFVNGKTRADDGVALVFVKQLSLSSFRVIRAVRGLKLQARDVFDVGGLPGAIERYDDGETNGDSAAATVMMKKTKLERCSRARLLGRNARTRPARDWRRSTSTRDHEDNNDIAS